MKTLRKKDFPLAKIRRYLEPGPIVLVSPAWKGERDIMTMGWHMMLGLSPALFGCYIWDENYSYNLIRKSRQCVINLPTTDLEDEAVGIGNTTRAEIDKFEEFGLTAVPAVKVAAPMIGECYANFECRLHDGRFIGKHGLFIWEVVKAHVAASPKFPKTLHYRGQGVFMMSGEEINLRKRFKAENL